MNNIVWSIEIDEILRNGISLESIGVKNWALPKQQALQVLIQFIELHVPVLGGDVCELVNGTIQYNYDNWYCEKLPKETHLDFVNRSVKIAKEYIEQYNIKDLNKVFFTFVPEV